MALILDHANGVRDDNRLENLRIVCPNCAATLPTHCGKGSRKPPVELECPGCAQRFVRRHPKQRYCSRACGQLASSVKRRKQVRPPYEQLIAGIEETNRSAVGRKYGVSEGAIRKWVRAYEREAAREAGEGS